MIMLPGNLRIPEPNLTMVISGPLIRSWLLIEGYTFLMGNEEAHSAFLEAQANKPLEEAEKRAEKK